MDEPRAEPLHGAAQAGAAATGAAPGEWPALPTETEIYILPNGRVVIADLPAELTSLATALGVVEACEITPHARPDSTL
jgi:hypothetical protein